MKRIALKKGLDVPISGAPRQTIGQANTTSRVALLGDDYIGMKPTMEVAEGQRVKTGQLLFTDKKNAGVRFTAPATGKITAINRGAKRKFESVVIETEEDDFISFLQPDDKKTDDYTSEEIREILIQSGLWPSFRTRPYGKTPRIDTSPASLFVTAMDSRPLAADAGVIIGQNLTEFTSGLTLLTQLLDCPLYLCLANGDILGGLVIPRVEPVEFSGPHPAGLPSTHIHFLDPVKEDKFAWHIDYQDVIGIGSLFRTGHLKVEKTIALAGPGVKEPRLMTVRIGGDLEEICANNLIDGPLRILSGSALDGRQFSEFHRFLGRYHNQITVLHEGSGRSLFGWARLGSDRHSIKGAFTSALDRTRKFGMNTALWGGRRAIYPIDSYHRVMPLDMEPLTLLKSIASKNTDKASSLGALEIIEEDVALLSYVCPGKNDFGPMLRELLNEIEAGG